MGRFQSDLGSVSKEPTVTITLLLKVTTFSISELLVLNLDIDHLQPAQATGCAAYRLPLWRTYWHPDSF